METVDQHVAWAASEPVGYDDVLFRDVLAFFNRKERHIIIALRHGKTVTEIARDIGLQGHAALSRRLKLIKERLRLLMK